MVLASLILLSSLFHFSDTESKTEDHCFVGFPAIWNIVAFYVFAFHMPPWAGAVPWFSTCVVFTFVPMRWAHPLRTPMLWPATLAVVGIVVLGRGRYALVGFPAGSVVQVALLAGCCLWRRSGPRAQPARGRLSADQGRA